jgi:hypothetical protein
MSRLLSVLVFLLLVGCASADESVSGTATSTTTPTDVPTADPVLVDYAAKRDDLVSAMRQTKADFEETFGQIIHSKVSGNDPEWRSNCHSLIDDFTIAATAFYDLTPPSPFQSSHELTANGIEACVSGFNDELYGITSGSHGHYHTGLLAIGECDTHWNEGDSAFWQVVLDKNLIWPEMSQPTLMP